MPPIPVEYQWSAADPDAAEIQAAEALYEALTTQIFDPHPVQRIRLIASEHERFAFNDGVLEASFHARTPLPPPSELQSILAIIL